MRGAPCAPKANWVTDAIFKGSHEKQLEEFAKSEAGKRAQAVVSEGGGFATAIEFGRKEVVDAHVPGNGHIIDVGTRVLMANLINMVIDIPILNEATEQILALKVRLALVVSRASKFVHAS